MVDALLDRHAPQVAARQWHFEPCGDRCVILVFATAFSTTANRQAAATGNHLRLLAARGELAGVTDIVSAMVTVGVHYSPEVVALLQPHKAPFAAVCEWLADALQATENSLATDTRRIEIPVCYEAEYAPDLPEIAQACGLTQEAVIEAHTADWVDVLMVGFAPGHPYIGLLHSALALPRRSVPRTRVPVGSVGIANRQSVIYPAQLPGGWHLVGRTPLPMFSTSSTPPCLLKGGDQVRFVAISGVRFEQMAREVLT
jgi:KipI family sensor histidine kinase inhibitor